MESHVGAEPGGGARRSSGPIWLAGAYVAITDPGFGWVGTAAGVGCIIGAGTFFTGAYLAVTGWPEGWTTTST